MRTHKNSWLDIFSTFRIALDVKKMALGALGVYITVILLAVLLYLASLMGATSHQVAPPMVATPAEKTPAAMAAEREIIQQMAPPRPSILDMVKDPTRELPVAGEVILAKLKPVGQSIVDFFNWESGAHGVPYRTVGFMVGTAILLLLVWAFFGGGIARIAAVDTAKGERPTIAEATSFAGKKYGSFFWAPLVPFIFVVIFLLCNALLGLVGRIPYLGPILVGIFFFLALLSGFIVVMLLLGGIFGCIFMWPTIAMEGTDAFDAISRGFNYLFARPWKVLWCSVVAIVYGTICVAFVAGFTWVFLRLSTGAVAWGMGSRFDGVGGLLRTWDLSGMSVPDAIGGVLIIILFILAAGLVGGFVVSFKISAMTVIYNVLRHDVDGTDMSEVFLPEPEEEEAPAPQETPSEGPPKSDDPDEAKPKPENESSDAS